jgi:hypothetical protein
MKRRTAPRAKAATTKKRVGKRKSVQAKRSPKRQAPIPAKTADAIDRIVDASAQALGLNIEPVWHGGVKFNLQLILRFASLFDEFPLPDDAEPAPIFHA